mmetsp:Transcript_3581/g.6270  ORF Transcript_3581/g.6270 Transcript_3581/m.6270 type:complete len:340 (-) Transcript_3581:1845-2864(-)
MVASTNGGGGGHSLSVAIVAGAASALAVLSTGALSYFLYSHLQSRKRTNTSAEWNLPLISEWPASPETLGQSTSSTRHLPSSHSSFSFVLHNIPELAERSLLERKIASTIRTISKSPKRKDTSKIKSINALLMKLPKLASGFEKCRATFSFLDTDSNGSLDLDELVKGCQLMRFASTESVIREVFTASHIQGESTLEFREFLIALALLYLLHYEDDNISDDEASKSVRESMEIALEAFFYFDIGGDGFLQKEEVMIGMVDPDDRKHDRKGSFKAESQGGAGSSALESLSKVFFEMDADHSGIVSFTEFLFAVASWAGLEDDDDEEEEQQQQQDGFSATK